VPDYVNSTVRALGIGPAFRKHPVGTDVFLYGYNNIFPPLCNYMPTNPSTLPPTHDTKKMGQQNIFIPNSEAVSICQKVMSQERKKKN